MIGDIIGVPGAGTATVDVCDVERLMLQRDTARTERDDARQIAASLGHQAAELQNACASLLVDLGIARRLLELTVAESPSHAYEEQLGRDIAEFLRETSP